MKLLLVSTALLWDRRTQAPFLGIRDSIQRILNSGNGIFLVSSHPEPRWLAEHFPGVKFQPCSFRRKRNGEIVHGILDANREKGLKHSDVVVFGSTDSDFFMAVQSKTLLIRCEWVPNLEAWISRYGLPVREASKMAELVEILRDSEPWYFRHTNGTAEVFALTNAGTIGEIDAGILTLLEKLKGCLKQGRFQFRNEFIAHLLSSLCATDMMRYVGWWGWYPSSQARSSEMEVMKVFADLARTTFARRTRGPLFIRHQTAPRRHVQGGNRTDPTVQLKTVHLNLAYRGRLEGQIVAILDDYLTYGVSFAVATAMLRKAGVTKVICIAMGKFGSCAQLYDIAIQQDDVFSPLSAFKVGSHCDMTGDCRGAAQADFAKKFRHLLTV